MEEKYNQFLNYNWNESQEWRTYFNNLSDIPRTRELVMHFRKRFYKFKVDPNFDCNYNPESAKEVKQNPVLNNKGLSDNLFASIEGFIWVAFCFNVLMRTNLLKLCLVATSVRFFRKTEKMRNIIPKFNKEYLSSLLHNEHIQLLLYILLLFLDYLSFLLIFPILITALFCICDYFANYLKIFTFLKKYFEVVTNKKADIDSLKGFSFVLIAAYMILSVFINWHSFYFALLYFLYLILLYNYNDDVKKTFTKIRNSLELLGSSNKTPNFVKKILSLMKIIDKDKKNN